MKGSRIYKLILVVALVFVIGACSIIPSFRHTTPNTSLQTTPAAEAFQPASGLAGTDALKSQQDAYIAIYEKVNPAVVHIRSVDNDGSPAIQIPNIPNHPEVPGGAMPSQAIGSGFVVDKEGHIVTNNHVVDGAEKLVVTFWDGTQTIGTLVGADAGSDLAVIKVDTPADKLTVASLGESGTLKVGQITVAIGNPFGLNNSMTTGIVSGIGRMLDAQQSVAPGGSTYSIPDIIQTDTAINPGNSGGPLLDLNGNVIGVNTAIESGSGSNSGVGYAVPVDIVKRMVPQLIKDGKVEYPWLGVAGTSMNADLAAAMKIDVNQSGVLVRDVVEDSPAAKAGLKGSSTEVTIDGVKTMVGGDILVKVDDQPVKNFDNLLSYLVMYKSPGEKVKVEFLRDGKMQTAEITLAKRPAQ